MTYQVALTKLSGKQFARWTDGETEILMAIAAPGIVKVAETRDGLVGYSEFQSPHLLLAYLDEFNALEGWTI